MSAVTRTLEEQEAIAHERLKASTGVSSVIAYEEWLRILELMHRERQARRDFETGEVLRTEAGNAE